MLDIKPQSVCFRKWGCSTRADAAEPKIVLIFRERPHRRPQIVINSFQSFQSHCTYAQSHLPTNWSPRIEASHFENQSLAMQPEPLLNSSEHWFDLDQFYLCDSIRSYAGRGETPREVQGVWFTSHFGTCGPAETGDEWKAAIAGRFNNENGVSPRFACRRSSRPSTRIKMQGRRACRCRVWCRRGLFLTWSVLFLPWYTGGGGGGATRLHGKHSGGRRRRHLEGHGTSF